MELLREEATDDGGRDPPTVALLGGGGHTEAVSCFLRLGVLVFVMLLVLAAIACTLRSRS